MTKDDDLVKALETIESNGKVSLWSRIWDKIVDYTPSPIYRFCYGYLNYRSASGKIKRFWQRLTRGWDDSETWDLDVALLKWLSPRLKRLSVVAVGYPAEYESIDAWKKVLNDRAIQVDNLLKYNGGFDFDTSIYMPENIREIRPDWDDMGEIAKQSILYELYYEDFAKWLAKDLSKLWW